MWAQVPPPVFDAFLEATGAEATTMPCAIGVIPENEFSPLFSDLKVKGTVLGEKGPFDTLRALNFIERGELILLGLLCGTGHFAK